MTCRLQGQRLCMICCRLYYEAATCMPAALHAGALLADDPQLEQLRPGHRLPCLCRQLCFAPHG